MRIIRKEFSEWLASKADRRSVGDPFDSKDCALCKFMKENGVEYIEMQYATRVINNRDRVTNPNWMVTYQRRASNVAEWTGVKNITAQTARQILANV